jgi:peptidoglycan/LPS O-acetylase OafA/YrhL
LLLLKSRDASTGPNRSELQAVMLSRTEYRPTIDGLRGIAVLAVIAFHARWSVSGTPILRGGYFGVDVFFVISGYLIARFIFKELKNGTFSLPRFYERRARRILPALFLVIAISSALAFLTLTPRPLLEFSKSVIATIGFVANIFFWWRTDYFAEPGDLTPLLHTWSLSVEEQFYFLFPLMLVATWRYARGFVTPLLLAGTAAAFVLCLENSSDQSAVFYLFQYRAWEPLAGVVVARLEPFKFQFSPNIAAFLPGVGLGLIAYSMIFLGGQIAIVAVVGTALVIFFEGDDPASRLLAARPLASIGVISYSLYLWHQPAFVFARSYLINAPTVQNYVVLVLGCMVLSAISWRFVEQPFRSRSFGTRQFSRAASGAAVLLLVATVASLTTNGFPQRYSPEQLALLAADPARGVAFVDGRNCRRTTVADACIIGKKETDPAFAVLGDSHAETLTGPLSDLFETMSVSAYVYTYAACPFIADVGQVGSNSPCPKFEEDVIGALREHHITSVIVNDRSTAYIVGTRFDNGEGGVEPGPPFPFAPIAFRGDNSERVASMTAALRKTLLRLIDLGIKVYYVLPVPEVGWNVPRTVVKLTARHGSPLTTSLPTYFERNRIVLDLANDLSGLKGFVPIYPHEVFCKEETERCYTHGTTMFYTDTDHLSREGAELLVKSIAERLKDRHD